MDGIHSVVKGGLHDEGCRSQRRRQGYTFGITLDATLEWRLERHLALLAASLAFRLLTGLLFLESVFELRINRPERTLPLLIWPTFNLLERTTGRKVMPYRTLTERSAEA